MRIHSVTAPYLEIFLGTARLGMMPVYSGLQENQPAQEYGSRSHGPLDHRCLCRISIPAK